MSESLIIEGNSKEEKYISLVNQVRLLVQGESDFIANLSNIISVLKYGMNFFWVGVYFVKGQELVLGPFQGTLACTRIKKGRGVCGNCWENEQTVIVENVDEFPGHIACSSDTKSEIVVPIFNNNHEIVMVLDIDSTEFSSFDITDKIHLEILAELIKKINN